MSENFCEVGPPCNNCFSYCTCTHAIRRQVEGLVSRPLGNFFTDLAGKAIPVASSFPTELVSEVIGLYISSALTAQHNGTKRQHNTMQCSAMQHNAMQCNATQYNRLSFKRVARDSYKTADPVHIYNFDESEF